MAESPRFTDDAATILSEMVAELAEKLHRGGYQEPYLGQFSHTAIRWDDCQHPICAGIKMKAMVTLRDDEPAEIEPTDPLGLGTVTRILVLPPNGDAEEEEDEPWILP